jgi:hypothetical protein
MASATTIKNPGTYKVSGSFTTLLLVLTVVGAISFAAGLEFSPNRTWVSFLMNHFYFMSLALGGIFFASLQWLTSAMWSAPIRRIAESLTSYLPVVAVTFIILYFGISDLYVWSHPEHVKGNILLEGKSGYLSVGFFVVRNLIAVAIWYLFSKYMVGNSIAQDQTRSFEQTAKNRWMAPPFLMLFAVTFTMASFDQIMSLDPTWFSTIFGVYTFAGLFYSTLALTCVITLFLRAQGKLDGILNENHLHDLGKFMFAFTVFWAYIAFSQFMLIWYANMPEETGYYLTRLHGGWFAVSAFLLFGKFVLPFFFLLPREAKRNPTILKFVGCFMLVAQWIDMMWLVQPEFFKEGPKFGLPEIGVTLGFIGVFGLCVTRFLEKNNIIPIGDPRLAESVFHHHQ